MTDSNDRLHRISETLSNSSSTVEREELLHEAEELSATDLVGLAAKARLAVATMQRRCGS